jgi:hypothetical protein
MALRKEGKWWHGDRPADLDEYLLKVFTRNGFARHHHVVHARCGACSGAVFDTYQDDSNRLLRVCSSCGAEHSVCDLDKKFDPESAGEIVCECMWSPCELAVGFCLAERKTRQSRGTERSESKVKYLFVATRCTDCGRCVVCAQWDAPRAFSAGAWFESV